jgi:hypothetical protein
MRKHAWSKANQDVIRGAGGRRERNDGANGHSLRGSRILPNLIDYNVRPLRGNDDMAECYDCGFADS